MKINVHLIVSALLIALGACSKVEKRPTIDHATGTVSDGNGTSGTTSTDGSLDPGSNGDDASAADGGGAGDGNGNSTSGDSDTAATGGDPSLKLTVTTSGRQLLVDGKPFIIKGVCYNPVPKGKFQPLFNNPDAAGLKVLEQDFKLMNEAGINTIRTYSVIESTAVLDLLVKYNIFVIVPVLNVFNQSDADVTRVVKLLKEHRSTLFWQVGNEWNFNNLYGGPNFEAAKAVVKRAGAAVKANDLSHPLSTDYGEVPDKALVDELKDFDIWALNIYSDKTFGDRFARFKAISGKPMLVGEFGADAYNANIKGPDLNSQAIATEALIKEITANLSATSADNAVLGGTIFEWNDELWKDGAGSVSAQDVGGTAPGGGPFPDGTSSWGRVDIDRNVRPAYNSLKALWKP